MAATMNFAAAPRVGVATINTANTSRNGTGTITDILTAGTSGSRIDYLSVKALGVSTAGMVRFYIHNGTSYFLLTEIEVLATAASSSVKAFESFIELKGGIGLPSGYKLGASTEKAESFSIMAFAGDF